MLTFTITLLVNKINENTQDFGVLSLIFSNMDSALQLSHSLFPKYLTSHTLTSQQTQPHSLASILPPKSYTHDITGKRRCEIFSLPGS